MKSRSAHCIRAASRLGVSGPCRSQRRRSGGNSVRIYLDPAWKCREASWPRGKAIELTDQAVCPWFLLAEAKPVSPSLPGAHPGLHSWARLLLSEPCACVPTLEVSSSCWQACPLLCACRVICAVSPGRAQSSKFTSTVGPGGSLQAPGSTLITTLWCPM